MTRSITHRGPDADGHWLDPERGVALGHRRLKILDLSSLAAQPMRSRDGRWTIIYNGEGYNWRTLRSELEALGDSFRSSSDTEVIVAGFARWGVRGTVDRLVGMFAFAVWDARDCELLLVRDRFGEKPLYWGWHGGVLLFGSELKALRAHGDWTPEVDRAALASFLQHGYVGGPASIFHGIEKLEPATILTVRADGTTSKSIYWNVEREVVGGRGRRFTATRAELVEQLQDLLCRTIRDQMVADVPLGAMLSGGIDSSLVVALMQHTASGSVRTFTIGFHEAGFNEAHHAKVVARLLGTQHTELYLSPVEARAVIPELSSVYDEPFADVSQIPMLLVSKLARQHVTVALSGDGGDEIFAGYTRYAQGEQAWRMISRAPAVLRAVATRAMTSVSTRAWDRGQQALFAVLGRPTGIAHFGEKMHKLAGLLTAQSSDEMYRRLVSQWPESHDLVLGLEDSGGSSPVHSANTADHLTLTEQFQLFDARSYLPDDILVKVDRAAMRYSLETRAPFLDHRVAEFAYRLPLELRVRGGRGKILLRDVLARYVPRELTERPKMGFGVPIDRWLRHELREWGESLLSRDRLIRDGFLSPDPIRRRWNEHQGGGRDWQYSLWAVLMFQSWLDASREVRAW